MNWKIIPAAMLMLTVMPGCSGVQTQDSKAPAWLDGNSGRYPESHFLLGRGTADTSNDASQRARENVASILHDTSAASWQESVGEAFWRRSGPTIEQDVDAYINELGKTIEIVDTWQDASEKYHALAVLQHKATAMQLRREIIRLDDETAMQMKQVRSHIARLTEITGISQALMFQYRRQALYALLRMMNPDGRERPSRWHVANLQQEQEGMFGRIYIQPQVADRENSKLLEILSDAITAAGFTVVRQVPGNYNLEGRLSLDEMTNHDGRYWLRGSLELVLVSSYGSFIGAHSWPLLVSAVEQEDIQQNAYRQMALLLNEGLRDTLMGLSQE